MHLMVFKLILNFFHLNLKIHAVKGYSSTANNEMSLNKRLKVSDDRRSQICSLSLLTLSLADRRTRDRRSVYASDFCCVIAEGTLRTISKLGPFLFSAMFLIV